MSSKSLFSCCPKELVTDGFLQWLFIFLNDRDAQSGKLNFINALFAKDGLSFQDVSGIKADRQVENVDLMVQFTSQSKPYTVLFENKTWSSPHSDQLAKYKQRFPELWKYIYLKLAFIPYCERAEAEKNEYTVVTSSQLLNAITPLRGEHPFIDEYCEYLLSQFVIPQSQLEDELFEHNNYEKLGEAEAQQFVLSELEDKLTHRQVSDLYFKVGSSFGRPWTQLDIAAKSAIYAQDSEWIFWRIDMRSGRHYIRLNQYADISDEFRQHKIARLNLLRNICREIGHRYGWRAGQLSDRGLKESEIAVFFLDENPLNKIRHDLENFSLDFIRAYSGLS